MKKIIVIIGPTASGKTALSIDLAKKYNGEIINGDSLQVYRSLTIGTAKITPAEMESIPHHLLDICSVDEPFTASDFKRNATQAIEHITKRGKTPIIVGGTGLYIEGLLFDFHYSGEQSNDPEYRAYLESVDAEKGSHFLWQQLAKVDPKASELIHPNNSRRIIRALEVIHASNRPFSANDQKQSKAQFDSFIIATNLERTILYERINQRVEAMDRQGLEAEARFLYDHYHAQDIQAARGIGYKEWFAYFNGEQTRSKTIELIQQHSRQYAKRQLTWFRNRMPVTKWFDTSKYNSEIMSVTQELDNFLAR